MTLLCAYPSFGPPQSVKATVTPSYASFWVPKLRPAWTRESGPFCIGLESSLFCLCKASGFDFVTAYLLLCLSRGKTYGDTAGGFLGLVSSPLRCAAFFPPT